MIQFSCLVTVVCLIGAMSGPVLWSEERDPEPLNPETPLFEAKAEAENEVGDDVEERRPSGLDFLSAQQQALSLDQEALRALAILSFGYHHRTPNRYRRVLGAALERLQSLINADGSIHDADLISHALVAYVLTDALDQTRDPTLVAPVRSLIDHIISLALHGADGTEPWIAWPSDGSADSISIRHTFFAVMALRNSEFADSQVGNHLEAARRWLRRVRALSPDGGLPARIRKDFADVSTEPSLAFGLALLALLHGVAPADAEVVKVSATASLAALDEPAPALDEIWATSLLSFSAYTSAYSRQEERAWHNGVLERILAQQGDDGSWPAAGDGRWSDSISRSAWMLLILSTRPRWVDNPVFQNDE